MFTSTHSNNLSILHLKSPLAFSSVQCTQSCLTLCDPMNRSIPGVLSITNSQSLLKLMPIESVMPSSCLILCRPLLLLPSIFPSIRVPCIQAGGLSLGVDLPLGCKHSVSIAGGAWQCGSKSLVKVRTVEFRTPSCNPELLWRPPWWCQDPWFAAKLSCKDRLLGDSAGEQ